LVLPVMVTPASALPSGRVVEASVPTELFSMTVPEEDERLMPLARLFTISLPVMRVFWLLVTKMPS
jgi:hypothetical protein